MKTTKYIDGDKLLKYYEERHKNLCKKNGKTDAYCQGYEDAMYVAKHLDFTADVVPRAEVEQAKADVAREIFAEIEELIVKPNGMWLWQWDLKKLAELKKKYTEREGGAE